MADKILFMHIGGTKTGSTALQNFFEKYAPQMEALGYAYEHRFNIQSDYEINSGNGVLLYERLSFTSLTDSEIDHLILSYFGRCRNAIRSSECLTELSPVNWQRLSESSARLGVKLKVIFYMRNVLPFLVSAYDQVVKCQGEWRSFDEWAIQEGWLHATAPKTLRIIEAKLPKENIHVLHFDSVWHHLIGSFLSILGIDRSLRVNPDDQQRRVNRSLTRDERKAFRTVNRALGPVYSQELSELLVYPNPDVPGEPAQYDTATAELLLARFSRDVDWINDTFFDGQSVLSVMPVKQEKEAVAGSIPLSGQSEALDKKILEWALEKLKTAKEQTGQRLVNVLIYYGSRNVSGQSHPDVPVDFDPVAYLLLNPDLLHAEVDPVQHYINHGKREGRTYNFLNLRSSSQYERH